MVQSTHQTDHRPKATHSLHNRWVPRLHRTHPLIKVIIPQPTQRKKKNGEETEKLIAREG